MLTTEVYLPDSCLQQALPALNLASSCIMTGAMHVQDSSFEIDAEPMPGCRPGSVAAPVLLARRSKRLRT